MQIELKELIALINANKTETIQRDMGQQIVVLDRGFVYVGNVEINGDFVTIKNAKNIRYWGTKNGLGELRNGPTKETKMDEVGLVETTLKAVIHFIKANGF